MIFLPLRLDPVDLRQLQPPISQPVHKLNQISANETRSLAGREGVVKAWDFPSKDSLVGIAVWGLRTRRLLGVLG